MVNKKAKICSVIGYRIKELRMQRGQSQLIFSAETGINRSYLADVEIGKRNISVTSLDKIIKALDISYQDFFDSDAFKDTK